MQLLMTKVCEPQTERELTHVWGFGFGLIVRFMRLIGDVPNARFNAASFRGVGARKISQDLSPLKNDPTNGFCACRWTDQTRAADDELEMAKFRFDILSTFQRQDDGSHGSAARRACCPATAKSREDSARYFLSRQSRQGEQHVVQ